MARALSVALFLLATATFAADPKIEGLSAVANAGKVSVRYSLAHAFDSGEMSEGLQSGLPTSIRYHIEIFRDRPNWFDIDIARSRIEVICTFNSVTREYLLNYRRDKKLVRSEVFSELDALIARMTRIDEPDLFEIGQRTPFKLKVRVKADLTRGWLLYVVPWEISTRWRETRVKRLERPQ